LQEKSTESILKIYKQVPSLFTQITEALNNENRKDLKNIIHEIEELNDKIRKQKSNVYKTVLKLQADNYETGNYYIQILDYQRDIANGLSYLIEPIYTHVDNQHKGLLPEQAIELKDLAQSINRLSKLMISIVQEVSFEKIHEVIAKQTAILDYMKMMRKNQIKRIQQKESNTRNSNLFLNMLLEVRKLLAYQVNMLHSYRDFVDNDNRLKK
jgi:Na+/phosphate symporter